MTKSLQFKEKTLANVRLAKVFLFNPRIIPQIQTVKKF